MPPEQTPVAIDQARSDCVANLSSSSDVVAPARQQPLHASHVPIMPRLGDKELHIAPMLDVTTREFRYLMRLLTKRSVLWTEMVVGETLVHCDDPEPHLAFQDEGGGVDCVDNHPIVCQIGGNVPSEAAYATRLVHRYGYDRVDLNAECPSDRVTGRREFGAALMKDPDVAVDMVEAIVQSIRHLDEESGVGGSANTTCLPFSVKTRIGVDESECLDVLLDYVGRLVGAGCRRLVLHARKVHTKGLSPAQNRSVPPLNYQRVYRVCTEFPECDFILNGGLRTLEDARRVAYGAAGGEFTLDGTLINLDISESDIEVVHRNIPCEVCCQPHGSCIAPSPELSPPNLRGVMLGRLAMDDPSSFADVDRYFFGEEANPCETRREVLEKYAVWLERVYPRRCCDDDPHITLAMNLDGHHIPRVRHYCPVCQEVYGKEVDVAFEMDSGQDTRDDYVESFSAQTNNTSGSPNDAEDDIRPKNSQKFKRHARKCPGAKIISRVIDRALKPIHGILFGQQGNTTFKRELHRLSRDMTVRNCGPSFMLRIAMECVKPEIWDRKFAESA